MLQKNPINCFYGDKFPLGGARFLSASLSLSLSLSLVVERDSFFSVARSQERKRERERPYRQSMLIFSLIRYSRK